MLKRGQTIIFAPPSSSWLTHPFVASVGKVTDRFVRIKHRVETIGTSYTHEQVEKYTICIDGGDNEMKNALGAANEYHREMEQEIKAAREKYDQRIQALKAQHIAK